MSSRFLRITSRIALALMLAVTLPLETAQAGMVGTEQLARANGERERVLSLLERADVRAGLEARGVDVAEAKKRVAALTDEEVAQIAGKLDEVPAGGDVLGVIVFIFLVLLVTDILGFTKVFPFTRPLR
ncbi:PA2779 family protein [Thiobacter aerophilum]|uniref:PA2779 family protein n=1 Tax=Thiobacter aerophilum TaxID=3121275 RepID=A0ABV0EIN0_9BURK